MHADKAVDEAASAIAKYGEKDNEKFKLLDLALRTLARVKAAEGLGVIEEVDEEEPRVKDGEEVNQEVMESNDQEVNGVGTGKV